MKFDPAHPKILNAIETAADAMRDNTSMQVRYAAMRMFAEMLAEAVGDFGVRSRRRAPQSPETLQEYLEALRHVELLTSREYADFEALRKAGNPSIHGDELYLKTRRAADQAFRRLFDEFTIICAPPVVVGPIEPPTVISPEENSAAVGVQGDTSTTIVQHDENAKSTVGRNLRLKKLLMMLVVLIGVGGLYLEISDILGPDVGDHVAVFANVPDSGWGSHISPSTDSQSSYNFGGPTYFHGVVVEGINGSRWLKVKQGNESDIFLPLDKYFVKYLENDINTFMFDEIKRNINDGECVFSMTNNGNIIYLKNIKDISNYEREGVGLFSIFGSKYQIKFWLTDKRYGRMGRTFDFGNAQKIEDLHIYVDTKNRADRFGRTIFGTANGSIFVANSRSYFFEEGKIFCRK